MFATNFQLDLDISDVAQDQDNHGVHNMVTLNGGVMYSEIPILIVYLKRFYRWSYCFQNIYIDFKMIYLENQLTGDYKFY